MSETSGRGVAAALTYGENPAMQQREQLILAEKKVRSQFNEDGILHWLFEILGTGTQRFVEFGIENGKECNTAYLSLDCGWSGTLLEGNARMAAAARGFYEAQGSANRVSIQEAFVTTDNINSLLADHAQQGPTDLLSIDIDGNDLWGWRAIQIIQPRVVIIEYNAAFGAHRSVSVKYDPAFERMRFDASGLYHGASLTALHRVGIEKGFALIGCESHGVNAIFVQNDLLTPAGLVAVNPVDAFYEHAWRAKRFGSSQEQMELIQHLDYERI